MGTKRVATELKRETVYNYIKDNPAVSTMEIAKAFGFTKSQADYYIRPMVGSGILTKTATGGGWGRTVTFTIGKKLFVRKAKTDDEKFDAAMQKSLPDLPKEAQGVARIVRLSGKHMQPPPSKHRRRVDAWRGSSMTMFDSL